MPYVCNDCGNHTEGFIKDVEITTYGTERILVDCDNGYIESLEKDYYEDEQQGDTGDYECDECQSDDVEWLEGKDYDDWLRWHYKEDVFFKEELSEEEEKMSLAEVQTLRGL